MAMTPSVTFRTIDEPHPGGKLAAVYAQRAPAYAAWYLQHGGDARPSAEEGLEALRLHMPELVPVYEAMVREVGSDDPVAARMFTMWKPPGAAIACSQAVLHDAERGPRLARNYDYPAELMDAVILRSAYLERAVIGVTDAVWGLCDGMNDRGLAVSLTFGGRASMGEGFGAPIVIRYLLETCDTVEQARTVLARLPSAHTHNLTLADASGGVLTAYLDPDRPPSFRRLPIAVNHQWVVESWDPVLAESTLQREWWLLRLLRRPRCRPRTVPRCLPGATALQPGPRRGSGHRVHRRLRRGRGRHHLRMADATAGLRFDSFVEGEHEIVFPPSPPSV